MKRSTSLNGSVGATPQHRKARENTGAEGQNRTGDTRIFSPLLYQLSYLGTSDRASCLLDMHLSILLLPEPPIFVRRPPFSDSGLQDPQPSTLRVYHSLLCQSRGSSCRHATISKASNSSGPTTKCLRAAYNDK